MAVSVLNTDANLSGNTLSLLEVAGTVTALWTFDRDPSAPFAVSASSAVVSNLDADKLDGVEGTSSSPFPDRKRRGVAYLHGPRGWHGHGGFSRHHVLAVEG